EEVCSDSFWATSLSRIEKVSLPLDSDEKRLESNGYVNPIEHCEELVGLTRTVWHCRLADAGVLGEACILRGCDIVFGLGRSPLKRELVIAPPPVQIVLFEHLE